MAYHGYVYALVVPSGVKIGYSTNPKKRISVLCCNYKISHKDKTSFIGDYSKLARLLEGDIHSKLTGVALGGEVFCISFSDAVKEIQKTNVPSHGAVCTYLNVPDESQNAYAVWISREIRKAMIEIGTKNQCFITEATGIKKTTIKSMIKRKSTVKRSDMAIVARYLNVEFKGSNCDCNN